MIRGLTVLPENKISALKTTNKNDMQNRLDALAIAINGMSVLPENKIGALRTTSKDDIENRLTVVGDGKGITSSRIRRIRNGVRDVAKVVAKKQDLKFSDFPAEANLKDVERLEATIDTGADVDDGIASAPKGSVARMGTLENRPGTVKAPDRHRPKIMRARIRAKNLVERPWLRERKLVERPWLTKFLKYL